MTKKSYHNHYVYVATYNDIIVYIGKGSKNRYKHVTSGTSNIYRLNELHFKGDRSKIDVQIIKGFHTDKEAREYETILIEQFKPECNSWVGDGIILTETLKCHVSELDQYMDEYKKRVVPSRKDNVYIDQLTCKELVDADRKPTYTKIAREYCELYERYHMTIDNTEKDDYMTEMDELKSMNLDFSKHLEVLSVSKFKTHMFSKSRLDSLYMNRCLILDKRESVYNTFKLGQIYTVDEIIYNMSQLGIIDKAKIISIFFDVKKTTKSVNNKILSAYKIISKKELNND